MDNGHDSDCATHNAPAYPAGPCDCMPTQAMCRAAVVYLNGADVYDKLPREVLEIEEGIYAEVWKAMRAAGPANAENVMKVELTKEWCMNMAKIEARAAELHEGCRMPMEQAQELAASEMSEGRKALLAAFGAAAAAREQGLRGQYPKAATVLAEEVFSLRSALRQKHAEYDDMKSLLLGNARNLNLEGEQARQTAEYWKAQHLAGNVRIGELHDELAATALRSADHLRKAIKAEARAAELATDAQRYRILRNCNMDVRNRLEHYGGDALDERLDALNSLALGPNAALTGTLRPEEKQR